MQTAILKNTGALGAFSVCPRSGGNLLRVAGSTSFMDVLSTVQTTAARATETGETAQSGVGLDLLRALSGVFPAAEPETFADSDEYKKYLETKFGVRVTAKYFSKNQDSMDALGRSMSGNDVVIAPNILDEMATDREKAAYYEEKIQYWFDNIPKWKAESAAMGLTYEPCGVAIHEDGTVYYIGGGTETPERKAKILAAQKAQREKKMKHRQEQQDYVRQIILQKQADALTANWTRLSALPSSLAMTQKYMPNPMTGSGTKPEAKPSVSKFLMQ